MVVDELHMVCDPHRGLPLELSITKLLFSSYADRIQIIGMSATMGGMSFHKGNPRPAVVLNFCLTTFQSLAYLQPLGGQHPL